MQGVLNAYLQEVFQALKKSGVKFQTTKLVDIFL